jgi:oxygen-independent coproporphyrinogen-3 oxidase
MIVIKMYGEDYEQDIRPLIKSFYPKEELQVEKNLIIDAVDQISPVFSETELFLGYILKQDSFSVWMIDRGIKLSREHDFSHGKLSYQGVTRSIYRNELHRKTYELLREHTKQELPWGTLTGIRPTKQVLERLESGEAEITIREFMKSEYLCSDEKIDLSLAVAKREHENLKGMDYQSGYSVYVGIPFCPSTCNYCSFTSYPLGRFEHLVEPYLKALTKEIEYASKCLDKKLSTIYIGGGTPTTLSAKQLDYLLDTLARNFDQKDMVELTVEAGRPDSITRDKLQVLKDRGVDRISINPQSMRQKTLDLIGRHHTAQQIEEAFYLAREIGHDNINMDIILGLSGENPEDVSYTLDKIKQMQPDSLTVHTLSIKRAARLNTNSADYADKQATEVEQMLHRSVDFAKENNYLPYYLYRQKNMTENLENVGYAHYGKEGIYNILIMEEKQTILALGAGGSSKFVFHDQNRIERVENVKSVMDYVERVDEMIQRKSDFLATVKEELSVL